ncbi:hypothetical protein ACFQ2B_22240 [Streptomyces stramineus]
MFLFVAWYAAGLLASVGGLGLALHGALPHRPDGAGCSRWRRWPRY